MTQRHTRPTEKSRVTAAINIRAELRLEFPGQPFCVAGSGIEFLKPEK